MKFKSKFKQDILCVCEYNDGPSVYGFCQEDQDYLAIKQAETEESNSWLVVPLHKADKPQFDDYVAGNLKLEDLIKHRSGFMVEFDEDGTQISEAKVEHILPEMITLPA